MKKPDNPTLNNLERLQNLINSIQETDPEKQWEETLTLFQEHVRKINEATRIIKEIATKTSLLAINIAIMAEKSKFKGEGLQTISKEMHALVDQAKSSSGHTIELLANFTTQIEREHNSIKITSEKTNQKINLIKKEIEKLSEQK